MKILADVRRLLPSPTQHIFPIEDRSKGHFTQIDIEILERRDLSFRAKGLLLYLLSRPPDWKVIIRDILKRGREGRDAVKRALKELEDAGFIRRSPGMQPRQGDVWEIFEDPRTANEIPRNPLSPGAQRIHRIVERTKPFGQFSNAILTNPDLHFRSKGILAYLLSKPVTWRVSLGDVESHGTEGREAIRTSVVELEKAGHFRRQRGRSRITGRMKGYENFIFEDPDDPRTNNPSVGPPNDGIPTDGFPNDGNPAATKKDSKNKENKKIPPKSPRVGGTSSDSYPGSKDSSLPDPDPVHSSASQQSRSSIRSLSPPSRILDLPDDEILKPSVTMALVSSDPLARIFDQLFPNPPWTHQLARKFCKRVRSGMIREEGLELFQWAATEIGKTSFTLSKEAILKGRWNDLKQRFSQERREALISCRRKLDRAISSDPADVRPFVREFERLRRLETLSGKLLPEKMQPYTLISSSHLAQEYLAAFAASRFLGEPLDFSCRNLDEEDRKMLLMEVIGNEAIFSALDDLANDSDWSEALGHDWPTIRLIRKAYLGYFERMLGQPE